MNRLLIANRGEISVRIAQAAAELGIETLAIYTKEDSLSLHRSRSDQAVLLEGNGVSPYLNIDQIVDIAISNGCDAVHPGYGFLSENSDFVDALDRSNIQFVGPKSETLRLLGNKVEARNFAKDIGIPVLEGSIDAVNPSEALEFFSSMPSGSQMIIKALSGGGGRGMRVVGRREDVLLACERCMSEAQLGFGDERIYVEEFLASSKHIEVQVLGDGSGAVSHFWDRDCSVQRRHQKLIEVAPSVNLSGTVREKILSDAVELAGRVSYRGLGTVEFLLDITGERYAFIEVNPRLQVEHTITEMVTGVDLVRAQLQIASGSTLDSLKLSQEQLLPPKGYAIQCRINMETFEADGQAKATGGTISKFSLPFGPGVRCDTFAYVGYRTSATFDSLLGKLIVHSASDDYLDVVRKAYRSACEMEIEGFETNLPILKSLLASEEFRGNLVHTQFLEKNLLSMLTTDISHPSYSPNSGSLVLQSSDAGSQNGTSDPLAVLDYEGGDDRNPRLSRIQSTQLLEDGLVAIKSPMQGTVVSVDLEMGQEVYEGMLVLVMEAMKMEHVIEAKCSGIIRQIEVAVNDTVNEGDHLVLVEESEVVVPDEAVELDFDLDSIRPDLQEVIDRIAAGLDENRPDAVAKRRRTNHRTARENVAHLCDEGSFVEYGSMVVAGQRRRRSMEDLIKNTSGDGMVCGLGSVNGNFFEETSSRTLVVSYDYMVLAGTQGIKNHQKKDRLFELAEKYRLPTVLFAEGGGGRPGDTDGSGVAGLDCWAFTYFARLSGLVPMVGITTGSCFAGNAVLLACCDVIIATADSNIGIGGPAMIEGGGLGVFRPEEVGPMDVQVPNGVVDILVSDEFEAVETAKKYLSYFQGTLSEWEAPDQRALRHIVPENRLRYYDMRDVINGIADEGSVLELRENWGIGIITAFIRIEGRPMGVIANNPGHLSGAIDADGADKGSRFMQLCDAYDIPILSLCDCPGIMVGPESEKTAVVRHAGRMFVVGANIDIPLMTIVIRKGYGLGAQAMAGGSFHAPVFTVSWPTGEFGGMGLEGAVKLGYRKELQGIDDPDERKAAYEDMVADMYKRGKAVNMASHFEIDQVIDPAESRKWIMSGLRALPTPPERINKKRPNIDTW